MCQARVLCLASGSIPCEVHSFVESEWEVTAALLRAVDAAEQASEPALERLRRLGRRQLATGNERLRSKKKLEWSNTQLEQSHKAEDPWPSASSSVCT